MDGLHAIAEVELKPIGDAVEYAGGRGGDGELNRARGRRQGVQRREVELKGEHRSRKQPAVLLAEHVRRRQVLEVAPGLRVRAKRVEGAEVESRALLHARGAEGGVHARVCGHEGATRAEQVRVGMPGQRQQPVREEVVTDLGSAGRAGRGGQISEADQRERERPMAEWPQTRALRPRASLGRMQMASVSLARALAPHL